MKAAYRSTYGTSEVLNIREIEQPVPGDDDVLVKVHATTVNRSDYHVLTGRPLYMHLFAGFGRPKVPITGSDFAGEIAGVGRNVNQFQVGDRVMGFDEFAQSHATFLTIAAKKIVKAPANVAFTQIAASLEGGFYAFTVVDAVKPPAGSKALLVGATGAIGWAFLQFLNHYKVNVTAVCRGQHRRMIESAGAQKTFDYETEDFRKDPERYDFVFDAVGKTTFPACRHLLKPGGVFSSSQPNFLYSLVTPMLGGRKEKFFIPQNVTHCLRVIGELLEEGSFTPLIDRVYPLEKIGEAFTYVGAGQKVGNVVLDMNA